MHIESCVGGVLLDPQFHDLGVSTSSIAGTPYLEGIVVEDGVPALGYEGDISGVGVISTIRPKLDVYNRTTISAVVLGGYCEYGIRISVVVAFRVECHQLRIVVGCAVPRRCHCGFRLNCA